MEKLIYVTCLPEKLVSFLGLNSDKRVRIYRSKGLLTHLLKRKHFIAVKYFDFIPEIIQSPDYVGLGQEQIELVKCFKDNIFLCVKFDTTNRKYYISTIFDIKQSKIDSYCKSGRLTRFDKEQT